MPNGVFTMYHHEVRMVDPTKRVAIAVVSDLHCGSISGLMPPELEISDDSVVRQNPAQEFVWSCWQHYCEKVWQYPVAAVVVNGDAVEGAQPKSRGIELSLTRMEDQCLAAEASLEYLLSGFKKRPKVYFTSGTPYHVGHAAREEESLAKGLKAERYKGEGLGTRVRDVLNLDIHGIVLNFAHHVSVATVYKAQAVEKELAGAMLAELSGYPRCDAVIRSHVHSFRHVVNGYRHAATSPCWQLQTAYCRKPGIFRMRPDIGGLIVWVDPEARAAGDDPVHVQQVLYPLPPVPVVTAKVA